MVLDGQENPVGDDGICPVKQTQSSAGMTANGGVEGARSHDVIVDDNIRGMTDGDDAGGSKGTDGEPMELSTIAGTGSLGDVVATSI